MASNFTDAVVNDRRKLGNCDLEGQPVGSTFFVHKVEVDGQMHVITDGGRVPEKVVAAGDSVKVCMHWKNHDCSCPGCYEQISFGLRGSPLTCEDTQAYSGVMCKTFNNIREDQEVVGQGSWWWKCADHTIEDGFKMLSIKVGKGCVRANEFDAGWGPCDTYRRGESNYNWCDLDFDNLRRVWARDACSGCGECVDGSRGRRNLEAGTAELYDDSTTMASNFTDAVVNDRRKLGNCDLEGQPVGSTFFVHKVEVDGQMHVITDGGRVPEKVVAAGDSVKVCMHWKNHDCSCPGCYEQISFGLRGSPLTCEDTQAYSGVMCKTFNNIREDQEVVGQGSWWWKCADHTIEDGFKMLSIKVGKTCTRANEFDAGWGGCDTYQRGKSNYNWCDLDFDNLRRVWARDACSECGECVDGSRGRRNLEFSTERTDLTIEKESPFTSRLLTRDDLE